MKRADPPQNRDPRRGPESWAREEGTATIVSEMGGQQAQTPAGLARRSTREVDRYVEPFAGSACLFFALEPPQALLGDINGDLINTYRALKSDVEAVIRHLAKYKKGKGEYYRARSQNTEKLSSARRAARFIFLNRFCFNGIYVRTEMASSMCLTEAKEPVCFPPRKHCVHAQNP